MNAIEELLGPHALASRGSHPALICGDESIDLAELARRVRLASGAFAALGVRPGDRVLLLMRDTPECAAAWLGAVRLGAVAVALNTKLPESEYRHILDDSGARLALIEDLFAVARPDLTAELATERRIVVAGAVPGLPEWRAQLRDAAEAAPFAATAESPAFMLYSSGTTGRPKGIVHAHRAIAAAGGALRRFGLSAQDRILATSRLFFAYGLEHALLGTLRIGATSILSADWPTPEGVLELAAKHRPTALFSVPTMYRRLLAESPSRLSALRGIRRFVSAGEAPSAQLAEQWRAASGGEMLNLYGMSETFCACIVTPPGTADGVRTGLPLDGVELRLESDTATGAPGVLWVRHPAQAQRYENRPDETAAQFRDGWFCTRDLFTRDAEGYYVHHGRSDELVKIAGQWVRPAELEDAVAALGEIAEAACVAIADEDGLQRLALFVAARPGVPDALAAAAAACERALPRHKRPKWLRAVEHLPRTATGKVQRFKLRELLQAELATKR
ncbi:MAG: class I adenylate-forming enzyme family protein [Clostridia bacterium]